MGLAGPGPAQMGGVGMGGGGGRPGNSQEMRLERQEEPRLGSGLHGMFKC